VPSDAAAGKRAAALLASSFAALGLTEPDAETGQHAASGPQPLSAQPATQVLYGRYELVGIAASSPNARVIEASDRLSGKRVAVKQLLGTSLVGAGRDAFRRLVQEARVLQQVRHPNVVPLVQLVEDDAAIVTEWMAGGSLARLIAEQPLAPARAAEIARVVLDALGEAHRAGVLHRDVKPSNILFDGAGNPMLADFGAAHISDTSSTATAGVIGTYAYMSPEQRAGLPATAASDVYAAGALLLEMLTGQLPADGLQAVTLPSAVHPELGGEHDRLVLSMLAREPAARPASALAARDAITSLAWSGRLPARSWGAPAASGEPRDTRLQPVAADVFRDTWLERDVQLVVLDEHTARLARAYAAATCDALPLVLRADTEQGQLWFEKPAGLTLSQSSRALAEAEVEPVARALQRLHQAGAAHGAVDAEHLVIDSATGNLRLAFDPDSARKATPEHDLLALAALTRR
jgi:serine/threonine-protein kinase